MKCTCKIHGIRTTLYPREWGKSFEQLEPTIAPTFGTSYHSRGCPKHGDATWKRNQGTDEVAE